MTITRQTIKRLQKEADGLNPDKDRLLIALQDEDGLYFNNKTYKTIIELKDSEGIKDSERLIIISKIVAEKNDIRQTIK